MRIFMIVFCILFAGIANGQDCQTPAMPPDAVHMLWVNTIRYGLHPVVANPFDKSKTLRYNHAVKNLILTRYASQMPELAKDPAKLDDFLEGRMHEFEKKRLQEQLFGYLNQDQEMPFNQPFGTKGKAILGDYDFHKKAFHITLNLTGFSTNYALEQITLSGHTQVMYDQNIPLDARGQGFRHRFWPRG